MQAATTGEEKAEIVTNHILKVYEHYLLIYNAIERPSENNIICSVSQRAAPSLFLFFYSASSSYHLVH